MGEDTFKMCQPAPKYSQDMIEKENQSSTRSCLSPGDSVLKLPPLPLELHQKASAVGAGEAGGEIKSLFLRNPQVTPNIL